MSLATPTTSDISNNIVAQLEASLNQTIPLLPKSFIRVLAKALAAVFVLLYKYAGFISLQLFVSTASTKVTTIYGRSFTPLLEWGRLKGVTDPTPATRAELTISITVTSLGGTLDSGTQLVSGDNGVTYITIGAVLLDAVTVSATIRAVSDQSGGGGAGSIGNLTAGAVVSFANPLANVERLATVTAQTVTGADAESWDSYRQRVADAFQKKPQGGAYADYEAWGEEVAGIVNCYPYTADVPGVVYVYVEASDTVDGIPTTAQLQAVLDNIELNTSGLATRRPATALVQTLPISRTGFDINVSGLVVDNPATVQADITSGLENYLLGREPYIIGLSIPPRNDRITQSAVFGIVDGIVSAVGGIFSGVTITMSGSPISIYTLGEGEKAKASTVTFI